MTKLPTAIARRVHKIIPSHLVRSSKSLSPLARDFICVNIQLTRLYSNDGDTWGGIRMSTLCVLDKGVSRHNPLVSKRYHRTSVPPRNYIRRHIHSKLICNGLAKDIPHTWREGEPSNKVTAFGSEARLRKLENFVTGTSTNFSERKCFGEQYPRFDIGLEITHLFDPLPRYQLMYQGPLKDHLYAGRNARRQARRNGEDLCFLSIISSSESQNSADVIHTLRSRLEATRFTSRVDQWHDVQSSSLQ